ncbi:endonuclease [Streptomyces sp. MA5143a]|uniref:endonuclease n=1 Tax=Streptomyces sp. MA5143a TaxID=2083010 RepID=UPI000D1AEF7F|nr:endonuclease [Streptomyces sp. MA5143a]SPF06510.1 Extracellular ribonuclease precursor [Streptomyces sp. MA5143a]
MTTAELFSPTEPDYLSQLTSAAARYADRTERRERNREVLRTRGVLHADEPERVEKRLARLGADWSLATAIEREPSDPVAAAGSTLRLPPDSFGSDVLGLERLIGRNNLTPVAFLEEGALVSRSVGRVTINGPGGGHGTGFMVSPSLLLTNNHVLRSQEEARRSEVAFSLQAGIDGRPLTPAVFQLEPQRFFVTDRELDFSLVAVAERGARGEALASFGRLTLSEAQGTVVVGEYVNIIQHPRGEPKQLALRENQIVDILDRFTHYESDTREGSSGSPVFNDQWEVVALHHSAVPKTDAEGRPLSVDGVPWTPDMGDDRLAWKANEGVRISRVLRALREVTLTGAAARLRDEVFVPRAAAAGPAPAPVESTPPPAAPAPSGNGASARPGPDGTRAFVADGTAHLTIPLRISVGLDPSVFPVAGVSAPPPGPVPMAPPPTGRPGTASAAERDVDAALVNHRLARERPYYDRPADTAAREAYYAGVATDDGDALRRALTELLTRTHNPRPRYKPMRLVYPWVDLHRDGRLRSIYSGNDFSAEEFIRADAAVEAARTARIQELFLHEGTAGPAEFEAEFDALEASMPFNCEHVVPQSWFLKKEPMRGDLHHLFACEVGCNSFRGNFPYFDFPHFDEAVRDACGLRESNGFEPQEGKGTVARATLYFLLRYPKQVGDTAREFPEDRLPLLLSWHASEPVTEYELHRNAAIAELQGNRNPLIDHPEWAEKIDFSGVWP